MSNDIQAMINAALEQKPMEFEEIFGNALRDKLHDAIEARKEEIAQRLFATEEVEDLDEKKSLAALAPPRDRVTHKDVLVGRGVLKKHPQNPDKHVLAKDSK
jgi:hypothetical protein